MLMIVAGLGFRITAVPFHFYAPDVFQGASTSGAAFLSYIPKIAGFVAIVRVFGFIVPDGVLMPIERSLAGIGLNDQVPTLFWFLAALTMTIGNVLAILQDNLKRLMAYSSITHAGYMLVALAMRPRHLSSRRFRDLTAAMAALLLFYLIAYGTMTFGFFAVLLMLHRPERPVETVDDLAGLAKSHPGIALMVTVLMLSLIGFPLTVGFTGKLFVFFGAVSVQGTLPAGSTRLWHCIGVVNAAIGAGYYLRSITGLSLRGAVKPIETAGVRPAQIAMILCVVLTIGLARPPGANWVMNAGPGARPNDPH